MTVSEALGNTGLILVVVAVFILPPGLVMVNERSTVGYVLVTLGALAAVASITFFIWATWAGVA